MSDEFVVRSYRRVFRVDRRIYRVDRWALPIPGGVPLRAVGYLATGVITVLVLGALPILGDLVHLLDTPIRLVLLPLAIAVLGTQTAPDGRVAHSFARDWLALRLRSRRRSADRTLPGAGERVPWHGTLCVAADERQAQLAPSRVAGPARVTFNVPVELSARRGRLVARAREDGRPGPVVLGPGGMLEVRR
jgi:hypothetical protein